MQKKQLIFAILAIFALVGTIPFVMGADIPTDVKHITSPAAPKVADLTAVNTNYYGKITMVSPWLNSDDNIFTIQSSTGSSTTLQVRPNSGVLGQDIWITINSAFSGGKYCSVYTDSNGYVYMVYAYA